MLWCSIALSAFCAVWVGLSSACVFVGKPCVLVLMWQ